jgi:hypothetical protein
MKAPWEFARLVSGATKIVGRLVCPASPIYSDLWEKLSPEEKSLLKEFQPSAKASEKMRLALTGALNRIIGGPSIYSAERFAGMELGAEITSLLRENPAHLHAARLNRRLLELLFLELPVKLEQRDYNPENIRILTKVAESMDPELVTLIRMADEGGIQNSIACQLGPPDLVGKVISFQHPLNGAPLSRTLPDPLWEHLQGLKADPKCFCPRHKAMSENCFSLSFKKLYAKAGFFIRKFAIVRGYNRRHKEAVAYQRISAKRRWLRERRCTPDEIKKLEVLETRWGSMPPTNENSARRLTRDKIQSHLPKSPQPARGFLGMKNGKKDQDTPEEPDESQNPS